MCCRASFVDSPVPGSQTLLIWGEAQQPSVWLKSWKAVNLKSCFKGMRRLLGWKISLQRQPERWEIRWRRNLTAIWDITCSLNNQDTEEKNNSLISFSGVSCYSCLLPWLSGIFEAGQKKLDFESTWHLIASCKQLMLIEWVKICFTLNGSINFLLSGEVDLILKHTCPFPFQWWHQVRGIAHSRSLIWLKINPI